MTEKKILPPTYLLLTLIMMIGLHLLIPISQIIRLPWNLSGPLLIGIGLMMNIIVSNAFSKHQTTIKPGEVPSVLVTDGLFRVSRNPMYLGAVLLLIGVVITLGSLSSLIVIPLFFLLMNELFIKKKEKMLEETTDEVYLAYKKQVRRWL